MRRRVVKVHLYPNSEQPLQLAPLAVVAGSGTTHWHGS